MLVDSVEGQYYGDEDALPHSPGLVPVKVKYKPSPTPPPFVDVSHLPPSTQTVSSPSSRRHKKANRRKNKPTQGDLVLIRSMEPNRPDIAQQVSETSLNDDSHSESDDEDMDDQLTVTMLAPPAAVAVQQISSHAKSTDRPTLQEVLDTANDPKARGSHRDSVLEEDVIRHSPLVVDRRPSQITTASIQPNGVTKNATSTSMGAPDSSLFISPNLPDQQRTLAPEIQSHRAPTATSPNLQQLSIPRGQGPDTLPALQAPSPAGDSAVSPGQQQQLPSFRTIDDIARSATSEHDVNRANGFVHRQSISSVGTSPTSIVRQLSISSHSPATPFPPLSASSPISARDDNQRGDLFLRTGGGGVFGVDARRPSHAASDHGPYPTTLHSASTSESYQSSDGLSPGTQQTPIEGRPRHMSLDGAIATRFLPPPTGSGIQHIPSHASGAFKCDWPGCNAAPFQTQYLLK
jgi:hypothetical protein